jgi:hypothetical protein
LLVGALFAILGVHLAVIDSDLDASEIDPLASSVHAQRH